MIKTRDINMIRDLLTFLFCIVFILLAWATLTYAQPTEFPPGSYEYPPEPTYIKPPSGIVCADGQHPTCHPATDILCYNWCDIKPYSLADVYHWDGLLWKSHWAACSDNLEQWVKHAETLQKQVSKCKKWGK